jgi:glycosyltransferase involved in cell wall biosynthesis
MRFWWHVDTLIRHWSIPALLADYRLEGKVDVTLPPLDDRQLAAHYRQCSVTLHPGLGEGFGYPIFESLACGVPALHGCYAGGASIMETCGLGDYLIPVNSWRLDTQQNCLRPVYRAEDWVAKIELLLPLTHTLLSTSVAHLDWQALGPRWLRWFTDGIAVRRITNEEAVAVVSANPAAV